MIGATEQRIALKAAAALPGMEADHVHPKTVWRWATAGVRGVQLETVFVGGQRFTTREALSRFCEAVTNRANAVLAVARKTGQRRIAS